MENENIDQGFDFFADDTGSSEPTTQAETVSTEPATQPNTVSVDANQWQQTQNQLQAALRWQEDFKRFAGGGAQGTQPDPMAGLQQFVNNPDDYIIQKASAALAPQLREELRMENAANQARAKYPELAKYERHVSLYVNDVIHEAQTSGKQISYEQAIEQGIQKFQQDFPGLATNRGPIRMTLDATGAPQPSQGVDPSKMNNIEWNEYRDNLMRQAS